MIQLQQVCVYLVSKNPAKRFFFSSISQHWSNEITQKKKGVQGVCMHLIEREITRPLLLADEAAHNFSDILAIIGQ